MPNFIEIGPVVWISIADIHDHTHIDFYILDKAQKYINFVHQFHYISEHI
jgi:hypothetical protein